MTKGRVFVIADLHIGHAKCAEWRGFKDDMTFFNELMNNWNKVVRPQDKVYVLGDAVWQLGYLNLVNRLNGKKTLVAGNHDLIDTKKYIKPVGTRYVEGVGLVKPFQAPFKNVRGLKELNVLGHTVWLSHAPLHDCSFRNYNDINVHGHLHNKRVMNPYDEYSMYDDHLLPDKRYINVCCEHTNNTPVLLEDLIRDRFGSKEPNPRV